MADLISIDRVAAHWLAVHALNELHYADQEDGCCPRCCGPCEALSRLIAADQLDDLVRPGDPDGWSWWVAAQDRVDREFLARAWRMTDCHPKEADRG